MPFDVDIFIVGIGTVNVDQITLETLKCITASNEVLYIERGDAVREYLAKYCQKVTDLTDLYKEGGERQDTYRRMAAQVVDSALQRAPVTFALYGHPLVFSYPPFLVGQMASRLGLSVRVVPGISALDCMFVDLGIDPAVNGLQIYEATDLLLRRRPIQSDVPLFLWQIGALETSLFSFQPSSPNRFNRLKRYLSTFYPGQHRVFAIHSSTHPLMKPDIYEFCIDDFEKHAAVLHAGFSLYVPPVAIRPVADEVLARQVSDSDHLRAISLDLLSTTNKSTDQ